MAIEDDVERAWASIMGRLRDAAPATAAAVRLPAPESALRDAQQETGDDPWPRDVAAFYRLCDGVERTSAGYVVPQFCPLPLHGTGELDSVVGAWRWRRDLDAEQVRQWAAQPVDPREQNLREMAGLGPGPNPFDSSELETAPAGTPTGMWVRAWLPIAEDQSGGELVVDRRRGAERGTILTVDKVDVDHAARRWEGLGTLIEAVAEALRTGNVVAGTRYRPRFRAGELDWEHVPLS